MNIQAIIKAVGTEVNSLIVILIGLAVVVFIWGLVVFIFKAGDEKSHEEGKNRMIWGIIALFVMVSVWGIINFVSNDLGVGPNVTVKYLNSGDPNVTVTHLNP